MQASATDDWQRMWERAGQQARLVDRQLSFRLWWLAGVLLFNE